MIKPENYISIQGWMTQEPYNLKGTELIIYAIVFGFSQVAGHCFQGSLNYLCEWTNASRPAVIKNLNSLITKGFIRKYECLPTNKYYITEGKKLKNIETNLSNLETDTQEILDLTKESEDNNILKHKNNYINNKEFSSNVENIISYMNSICGTSFKSNTSETKKLIKARFKEGFSLDDFKKVIEYKYKEWGEKPVKFGNQKWSTDYLRPSTLFGSKFETYLYEANSDIQVPFSSTSTEVDIERSDLTF